MFGDRPGLMPWRSLLSASLIFTIRHLSALTPPSAIGGCRINAAYPFTKLDGRPRYCAVSDAARRGLKYFREVGEECDISDHLGVELLLYTRAAHCPIIWS